MRNHTALRVARPSFRPLNHGPRRDEAQSEPGVEAQR